MFTQLIKVSFFLYANIYTLDEKKLQSPGVHKFVNITGNKKKITKTPKNNKKIMIMKTKQNKAKKERILILKAISMLKP